MSSYEPAKRDDALLEKMLEEAAAEEESGAKKTAR